VFVGTAGVVVAVLAAALFAGVASVHRAGEGAAQRGVAQATDLVAQFLAGRQRALAGGARVFAQNPYFRALVAAQRRADLLDQAREGADQLGAAWVYIADASGRLVAASDEPDAGLGPPPATPAVGAPYGLGPLVAGALRGQVTTGFAVARDSVLVQAVAVPIVVPGLPPVGALVAAQPVDGPLARDVRAATDAEVAFYALDAGGAARVAATSFADAGRARRAIAAVRGARAGAGAPDGRRAPVRVDGVSFLAQGAAATAADGETVGGYAVLRRLDVAQADLVGVQRSLAAAAAVGLVLALAAAWATARRVTRPVRALAEAARRAADGDFRADEVLRLSPGRADGGPRPSGDEIAALGAAVGALLTDLRDERALGAAALDASRAPSAPAPRRAGAAVGAVVGAIPPAAGRGGADGLAPGALLAGRYQLDAAVGAGGTGTVWRARDCRVGEWVAVKVLRPSLAADPAAGGRFADELRLARRLTHRNVVRLHDIGDDDGVLFLTMEYVEGTSLAALLAAAGALPAPAVVSVAKQLTRALEIAHGQGVLHGDLKPANLLVGAGGVLKVADFGVARLVHAPAPGRAPGAAGAGAAGPPDIAGAPVGTPAFMAPELLLGGPPTVRSDLYAAGVVVQACLSGATPYDGDTPVAFFARKLDAPTAPPSRAGAPAADDAARAAVARAAARLAAPDPAARPASAREAHALFARLG
jgi:serine/threonine-protein kinase